MYLWQKRIPRVSTEFRPGDGSHLYLRLSRIHTKGPHDGTNLSTAAASLGITEPSEGVLVHS